MGVTSLQESELPEAQRFLTSVFNLPLDHRPFRLEALRWKAFDPHPEYPGPRGLIVRHGGRIVAHGIFSQLRFRGPGCDVTAQILMDWAADPAIPGVGVAIYQHMAGLADALIAIGGSEDAIKMLPLLGFRPRQQMRSYRLITSAWKHHMGSPGKDWKTPLRIGRDWARSRGARIGSGAGAMQAERIERFDEDSPPPLPDSAVAGCVVSARTPASLNYLLRCPIADMEAYLIMRSSEAIGYFILSRVGAKSRIAELWIHSDSPQDWLAAAELATNTAAGHAATGAVFTDASTPVLQSALEQIGFAAVEEAPVFLKDRRRRIPQDQPILLTMLENDAFYL